MVYGEDLVSIDSAYLWLMVSKVGKLRRNYFNAFKRLVPAPWYSGHNINN